MDEINSEWLAKRLGDDRGKRTALAEALGITPEKVSKMLSGVRKVQASEIPTILAFFGETGSEVDPELAELWRELRPEERVLILNLARTQIASRDKSG